MLASFFFKFECVSKLKGLPLCIDTENAMSSPASKEVSYSTSSNLQITTEITILPGTILKLHMSIGQS